MPARRSLLRALLVLLPAGALAAGLYTLFALRFEQGDVWPAYSSFRADPLGTKILYTALGETPGLRVERLLDRIARARIEPPATLLAAGLASGRLTHGSREGFQPLLDFIAGGGRAVLACTPDEPFDPDAWRPGWFEPQDGDDPTPGRAKEDREKDAGKRRDGKKGETKDAAKGGAKDAGAKGPATKPGSKDGSSSAGGKKIEGSASVEGAKAGGADGAKKGPAEKDAETEIQDAKPGAKDGAGTTDGKKIDGSASAEGAQDEPAHPGREMGSFLKDIGIEAVAVTQRQARGAAPAAAAVRPKAAVPEGGGAAGGFRAVEWHSALSFRPGTGTPWRVVYACGDRPVMVERPWGKGTLVLASDCYFLSNEAMLKHRHPALLAWIAGGSGRVVFDEYHLGVREDPGVTALARRYGLGGVFAALALLAGLFVWRNAASFLPPAPVESDRGEVAGGLESRNALLHLMRRHLPAADLPRICFEEWNRCRPRHDPRSDRRAARMKQVLDDELRRPEAERDPLAACRRLHAIGKEDREP